MHRPHRSGRRGRRFESCHPDFGTAAVNCYLAVTYTGNAGFSTCSDKWRHLTQDTFQDTFLDTLVRSGTKRSRWRARQSIRIASGDVPEGTRLIALTSSDTCLHRPRALESKPLLGNSPRVGARHYCVKSKHRRALGSPSNGHSTEFKHQNTEHFAIRHS